MSTIIPDIRFEGFSEEWKEVALEDTISLYTKGYAFKTIDYRNRGTRIIRVSDLGKRDIKDTFNQIYIDSKFTIMYKRYLINQGEIMITTVGSPSTVVDSVVGKPIFVKDSNKYLLNQNLVKLTVNEKYNNFFIYCQLLIHKYSKYISLIERGNANQSNIVLKDLWKFQTVTPSLPEQRAIGTTLRNLDNLIKLESQKLMKLKQFKQSMLQKLFPRDGQTDPEIRFKGFSGEWKEVALGELGSLISGVGFPESEQKGKKGIPFYKVSDMNLSTNTIKMNLSNNYVNESQIIKRGWNTIQKVPAILFAKVGAALLLNRKRLVEEEFLIDNNMMAFTIEKTDKYFTYYTFQTIYLPKHAQVGALPSFNASDISKIEISMPSLPEQEAIGTFFSKFDQRINAQEQKLTKMKQFKHSLLQKMFV